MESSADTVDIAKLLEKAQSRPQALSRDEVIQLLEAKNPEPIYAAALEVKRRTIGRRVSIRGLLEIGNVCRKNCFYCGIRRGNEAVHRYRLETGEILAAARWAYEAGYGNLVIQSGEIASEENATYIEEILRKIREFAGDEYGITLSLGEQDEATYQRWRNAGAHRYLLRIETSNPELYASLHPVDHSWEERRDCLRALRRCGYQVGTGIMCGLPGQTAADLADDISFFVTEDIDMIGMGPYIPHPATPLGAGVEWTPAKAEERLEAGLRMIAVARLVLHDVNIASATALQALSPDGRERGLLAGANVIMPNITDATYRADYQLYPGKPCIGESAALCRGCIDRRVKSIGEAIAWGERGDSRHWERRTHQ